MIIGISGKIGSGKDTVGKIIQYYNTKIENKSIESCIDYLQKEDLFEFENKYQIKKFANKLKDIVCLLIGCTRENLENHEFKNKVLGEEWRVYYITHYKLNNMRISKLFSSEKDLDLYIESEEFKALSLEIFTANAKLLTPRELLQLLGTDCGRDIIHPNIWVNSLFSEYRNKDYNREELIALNRLKGNEVLNDDWDALSDEDIKAPLYKYNIIQSKWIITDLRFPNELKAIEDRESITIRVNRTPFKWINPVEFNKEKGYDYYYDGTFISFKELEDIWFRDTGEYITKEYADKTCKYKEPVEHESETALDNANFKYTINNDGTIEELVEKVREILIKENII